MDKRERDRDRDRFIKKRKGRKSNSITEYVHACCAMAQHTVLWKAPRVAGAVLGGREGGSGGGCY